MVISLPSATTHGLPRLAVLHRLEDVLGRDPACDALVGRVVEDERELDELLRPAVLLADDDVLGDVDEAAREVARVGGPEGRVREALAGAVGRDEVLEHRQAFHEVGLDRALDDLALRIRHETAHAGELADLVERSPRSRVGHHVDRVRLLERLHHLLGDLVVRLRPDGDDPLVPLLLGHEAAVVLALDLRDLVLEADERGLLLARDDDVVLRDGDPGAGREPERQRLDDVERGRDRVRAVVLDEVADERVELALRQRLVQVLVVLEVAAGRLLESALDLDVEDHAAGRRHDALAAPQVLDRVVVVDDVVVEASSTSSSVRYRLRPFAPIAFAAFARSSFSRSCAQYVRK